MSLISMKIIISLLQYYYSTIYTSTVCAQVCIVLPEPDGGMCLTQVVTLGVFSWN